MAWNTRFVYRNYVDDSTILASDEVAGMPDDNIALYQPGDVWRADALSNLNIKVDVLSPRPWDVAWLGYTNLTPKRNLLRYSNTLDDAVWVLDSASIAENSSLNIAPLVTGSWLLTGTGAGSVTHGISQSWSAGLTMDGGQTFTQTFHINDSEPSTPADGVELAMVTSASSVLSVELEFSGGTLSAVTEGSGWSSSSASVETVTVGTTNSYKVKLTGTQANVVTSVSSRVRLMMGGSTSYVQSGEGVYLSQGWMGIGSSAVDEADTSSGESAAAFKLQELSPSATTISEYYPALPRDLTDWKSDVGWVHGVVYVHSSVRNAAGWRLFIADTNNADAYVEAGRLVIGKSFQPSGKLVTDGVAGALTGVGRTYDGGRRVFILDFEYLDQDTAERDFLDMYQHCKKREGVEIEAAGGQRYAPDNRPVLCILDDAAGAREPERLIYGTLEGEPMTYQFNNRFRTTVRVKELPA